MSGLYSKFVIKDKKNDVVHSSGYGVAQNGGAMGASSTVGFSERMRINNNRSRVKRFGDSKIATQFQNNYTGAKVYDRKNDSAAGTYAQKNGSDSGRLGGAKRYGARGGVGNKSGAAGGGANRYGIKK